MMSVESEYEVRTNSEETLGPSFVHESDNDDETKEEDYPFLFDVPSAANSPPLSPRYAKDHEVVSISVGNNNLHINEATNNNSMKNSSNKTNDIKDSNSDNSNNLCNSTMNNNEEEVTSSQQPRSVHHKIEKRSRVRIIKSHQPSSSWIAWITNKEGQRSLLEILGVGIIVFVLFRVWWRQHSFAYDSFRLWLEKYTEVQRHAMLLQMSRDEVVTTLLKKSSDTLLTIKQHSQQLLQFQKQQPLLHQTLTTVAITSAAASVASPIASPIASETNSINPDPNQEIGSSSISASASPTSHRNCVNDDVSTCSESLSDPFTNQIGQQIENVHNKRNQVSLHSVSPLTWIFTMPSTVVTTLTLMVDYVWRKCIWEYLFG